MLESGLSKLPHTEGIWLTRIYLLPGKWRCVPVARVLHGP